MAVDALIGAGKTTLIKAFQEKSSLKNKVNFVIVDEPVHLWTKLPVHFNTNNKTHINFLKEYYTDQQKYGALFQIFVLFTRYQNYKQKIQNIVTSSKPTIIIFDRSLQSTLMFTNLLYKTNKINNIEFTILKLLHNEYENYIPKIDLSIFLDVLPKQAKIQIKQRNRQSEKNIPIDYLQDLYKEHIDYFKHIHHLKINKYQLHEIDKIISQIDNQITNMYFNQTNQQSKLCQIL